MAQSTGRISGTVRGSSWTARSMSPFFRRSLCCGEHAGPQDRPTRTSPASCGDTSRPRGAPRSGPAPPPLWPTRNSAQCASAAPRLLPVSATTFPAAHRPPSTPVHWDRSDCGARAANAPSAVPRRSVGDGPGGGGSSHQDAAPSRHCLPRGAASQRRARARR